jgi:hypothetical protein
MALNPRMMLGLGGPARRPSMQFQQLNPAFQSDPRRILGQALMQQGTSAGPVRTPLQGLGRLSSALVGAYLQRQAGDEQVRREDKARDALLASLPADASPMLLNLAQTAPGVLQSALATSAVQPTTTAFTQNIEGTPGAVGYGTKTINPLTGVESTSFSGIYKPTKPAKQDFVTLTKADGSSPVTLPLGDPQIGTLLGQGYIERQGSAPTFNIDQTGEKTVVVESAKSGIKRLDKDMDKFEANIELLNRLDVARDLLADGMETGPIQNLLMPFRKIGVDLNLLSEESANQLSNQEVFTAISNYLIPRMRAEGSGATSNLEGAAFAKATITIDKNPRSNQMILAGMRQLAIRQNNLIREKEKWFYGEGNGTFKGFGDWADENVPAAFQRIESDEELTSAIEDGTISVGDAFYDALNKRYEILTGDML